MILTDKDIQTIKYEKRTAYVFSAFIVALTAVLSLFSLTVYQSGWLALLLVNLGVMALSGFISYRVNLKYDRDIAAGTKLVNVVQVTNKVDHITYEAGSGALYIPILASIFPSLWGQKMKPNVNYKLGINGYSYVVSKEVYENTRQHGAVEMHYAMHSNTLLGVELPKKD